MKAFVCVLASLMAVGRAQIAIAPYSVGAVPVAVPAAVPAGPVSSQYHAQDEFGQFSFGHNGPLAVRQEARDAFGNTAGGYSYVDANGQIQTVQYIADPINGFRVSATNLPVAPEVPEVVPLEAPVFKNVELVAPVFDLEGPAPVEDTDDVKAAKAKFFEAFEEAKNRERREAQFAYGVATPGVLPAIAPAPIAPALTYAAAPAPALTYAAAPAVAPVAYAAPSAPAVPSTLITIKNNPGHAVSYQVLPKVAA